MPEIDFRLGDVRNLHFDDGYFAGYWSLGVIEHSWKGYDEIAREMVRVLRPGGYLFLTFPHMSLLRRAKVRLGGYAPWQGAGEAPKAFYQFALDHGQVIDRFMHLGFTLRRSRKIDGIKGLKDEIDLLKPLLQPLYDYRGGCLLLKAGRYVLDRMLASWTGHVMILVLRKAVD
jgi:SAM-dependent methyltransferase